MYLMLLILFQFGSHDTWLSLLECQPFRRVFLQYGQVLHASCFCLPTSQVFSSIAVQLVKARTPLLLLSCCQQGRHYMHDSIAHKFVPDCPRAFVISDWNEMLDYKRITIFLFGWFLPCDACVSWYLVWLGSCNQFKAQRCSTEMRVQHDSATWLFPSLRIQGVSILTPEPCMW